MYTVILMAAMSANADLPACHLFGRRMHHSSSTPCCVQPVDCCQPVDPGAAGTDPGTGAGTGPSADELKAWTDLAAQLKALKEPPTAKQFAEWETYFKGEPKAEERKSFIEGLKKDWLQDAPVALTPDETKAWVDFADKAGKVKTPPAKDKMTEWETYYKSNIDAAERKKFLDDLTKDWLKNPESADSASVQYLRKSTILVKVPANVSVFFDGVLMSADGGRIPVKTQELNVGKKFQYTVTAVAVVDGKTVSKSSKVVFTAGSKSIVAFDFPSALIAAK